MAAVLIWLATIGVGLTLIVVTAALKKLAFHALICALISANFVILALRAHERRVTTPTQELALLALNARYAGCNWIWMSLAIIVMRRSYLAEMSGPMTYAIGGLLAALLCLGFARVIVRAGAERPDRIDNFLRIAGFMSFVQLIGALVTLSVLVVSSLAQNARYDWPSLNVIAFSTAALAIINARALVTLATGLPSPPAKLARASIAPGPVRRSAQG